MNFPEVWTFIQKQTSVKHETFLSSKAVAAKISSKMPVARMVSVLLPQADISDFVAIINDSDYYGCEDLKLSHILNKNFIDGFIRCGVFSCVPSFSPGSSDSFSISNNKLHLHLSKDSLQSLQAVELTSHKSRSADDVVDYTIDLLDKKLDVTKLNEELKEMFDGASCNFNWIPTSNDICCSSIAKHFSDSGLSVKLCKNKFLERQEYGLKFPKIPSDDDFFDLSEYIGMILLGCNVELNDFSSYRLPDDCDEVGRGNVIHCTGVITQYFIQSLINASLKVLEENYSFPWIAVSINFGSEHETPARLLIISRDKVHSL